MKIQPLKKFAALFNTLLIMDFHDRKNWNSF